jgi:hypothetical protein
MPTTWPYQMLTSPLRSRLERFHRGPGSHISPPNMTEPPDDIPSQVVLNRQPPPPHGTRLKLNTAELEQAACWRPTRPKTTRRPSDSR